MCGIVGYVGPRQAVDFLLQGLRRLEYRGYDSSGIATIGADGRFALCKTAGRIDTLEQEQKAIQAELADGTLYASDPGRAQQLAMRNESIEQELMEALERWDALGQL